MMAPYVDGPQDIEIENLAGGFQLVRVPENPTDFHRLRLQIEQWLGRDTQQEVLLGDWLVRGHGTVQILRAAWRGRE